MPTKREAAHALGMDLNTLTKWMDRCGIRGAEDPLDKRVRVLSDDDLVTIRERYMEARRRYTDHTRMPYADLEALEERVAQLEAVIASLRERSPYLFSTTERAVTPSVSAAHNIAALPPLLPQNRSTAPSTPASSAYTTRRVTDTLPEGWLAFSTWCKLHNLNSRAVEQKIQDGRMPRPEEGMWKRGQNTVLRVYTPEQQQEADRRAAILWPNRFVALAAGDDGEAGEAETLASLVNVYSPPPASVREDDDGE